MPSVEDVMVLLNLPVLEYLLYPHLRQSMGVKVKRIHKVKFCSYLAEPALQRSRAFTLFM